MRLLVRDGEGGRLGRSRSKCRGEGRGRAWCRGAGWGLAAAVDGETELGGPGGGGCRVGRRLIGVGEGVAGGGRDGTKGVETEAGALSKGTKLLGVETKFGSLCEQWRGRGY